MAPDVALSVVASCVVVAVVLGLVSTSGELFVDVEPKPENLKGR